MVGFEMAAVFLSLVALVGFINTRFLKLPMEVAMVLAGTLAAGAILALQAAIPAETGEAVAAIRAVNFPTTVLEYLLAFLLFAGAMQVNLTDLRSNGWFVSSLASLGVLASTLLVGAGLWLAAKALGLPLTLPWAFVFGALISPTDPIAVLAAVKHGAFPKRLQSVLQGEALFNDGMGIVIFFAAVAVATGTEALDPLASLGHVAVEALGGLALGLALGWIAIKAMRAIDDYAVEVVITLALATGAYALAQALHISGPIAVVGAGLLVGERGLATAMSETTQRYVRGFWTLVDEILNALLFLLLGLELAVIGVELRYAGLWIAAILLVVGVRLVVTAPWGAYFRRRHAQPGATRVLAWGGLHGALSLALALTLPPGPERDLVLSATYAVVLFSVVVQGLTFPRLAGRWTAIRTPDAPDGRGRDGSTAPAAEG